MDEMRVVDLEEFALKQIWRPYWPTWNRGQEAEHLTRLPYSLMETCDALQFPDQSKLEPSVEWRQMVLDRLSGLNVVFPAYVSHQLVSALQGLGVARIRYVP